MYETERPFASFKVKLLLFITIIQIILIFLPSLYINELMNLSVRVCLSVFLSVNLSPVTFA